MLAVFKARRHRAVKSDSVEKSRRQGIMMRKHCSAFAPLRVIWRSVKTEWFWNYYCQNQGGMCYRQILANQESGPKGRWA